MAYVCRMTKETAAFRNRFLAALADAVLIAHARPGSKTEALAREVIGWGKAVYTLDHPANSNLLELGARRMEAAELLHQQTALRAATAAEG